MNNNIAEAERLEQELTNFTPVNDIYPPALITSQLLSPVNKIHI